MLDIIGNAFEVLCVSVSERTKEDRMVVRRPVCLDSSTVHTCYDSQNHPTIPQQHVIHTLG